MTIKKSKVRVLLAEHHIPYYVRTINQQDHRQRTLGINSDYDYEYIIYVHKKDYPEAMYILNHARV